MSVSLDIPGKVAVVTGGSRGIGAATVRLFVQAGAKVVFNYQKAKDAADKLVAECGKENCHAVQAELSSSHSAKALVDAAATRFGRVDILVGNHGIWPDVDLAVDQMPDDHWRRTLAINLDSIFGLLKHGVAQIKKQQSGSSIVLVSS